MSRLDGAALALRVARDRAQAAKDRERHLAVALGQARQDLGKYEAEAQQALKDLVDLIDAEPPEPEPAAGPVNIPVRIHHHTKPGTIQFPGTTNTAKEN